MFRNIPTVTKNLLLINIVVFVAALVFKQQFDLERWGSLHFFLAPDFHPWQFITYMFLHGNFTHIFFNMFALWMFGCVIERVWGAQRFLIYYLVCGIGAGLCQELVQYVEFTSDGLTALAIHDRVNVVNVGIMTVGQIYNLACTIGASGAVYGILLAFGMTFPNERIFIFPLPVPIKAKWFVCIYAAIELFSAMATPGDNVAHFAHLGGMLFGYLLIRYWQRHPNSYYNTADTEAFFENMRRRWENKNVKSRSAEQSDTQRETDWEYNARKKHEQEEIDAILDKIRKSGYDSLTREEKQRLFDRKNNN